MDCIVLIGGTNNVSHNSQVENQALMIEYRNCLKNQLDFFKNTNFILSTIPYRYDLAVDSPENKLIQDMYIMIRQLSYGYSHVSLLDLYLLQSLCHTKHGLHVNMKGKRFISNKIKYLTSSSQLLLLHLL